MRKKFKGGVHPPDNKAFTKDKKIEKFDYKGDYYIPLIQHIGKPAEPVVKKNDKVLKWQVIGKINGFVSSNIHSPVAGIVKDIIQYPHPVHGKSLTVVITPDEGKHQTVEISPLEGEWQTLSREQIIERVKDAGIVGMGGATFPTHVKLSVPPEKKIDTVILNGAECEPYLTCDYRLMIEHPKEIIEGLLMIMKATGAIKGIIGIEDNKPEAYEVMKVAVKEYKDITCEVLPTQYPQGAEKMLIYALTSRKVPAGGLPMDVGVVVSNVATSYAIYNAVVKGIPLVERVLTLTGEGIRKKGNLLVKIGTPISAILEWGQVKSDLKMVINGGPMMGIAQKNIGAPVIKGTSGILCLQEVSQFSMHDCIRCGKCVDVCVMGLVPSRLSILGEKGKFEEMKEENVFDCIECGCCTYACPAKRPIVHFVRTAKAVLKNTGK